MDSNIIFQYSDGTQLTFQKLVDDVCKNLSTPYDGNLLEMFKLQSEHQIKKEINNFFIHHSLKVNTRDLSSIPTATYEEMKKRLPEPLYTLSENDVMTYAELVSHIQKQLNAEHASEINQLLVTSNNTSTDVSVNDAELYIKNLISVSLSSARSRSTSDQSLDELVANIFDDMAGESFIRKYRTLPGFQELNIDSYDNSWVNIGNIYKKVPEKFLSPQHAIDVIQRIIARSGGTLDEAHSTAIGSLSDDTRIAAAIAPNVDPLCGVSASIRTVSQNNGAGDKDYVKSMVDKEILDMIVTMARYGISMCIGGATNTGKSTLESWILHHVPGRIITIEDESKQLNFHGEDTVNLYTRKSEKADLNVDTIRLLDLSLKMHPESGICIDEMVSGEAFAAQEAARTDHWLLTSIHTKRDVDAYDRMTTLAQRVSSFSYDALMRLMVQAYPIIIYTKKSRKKLQERRIMSVIEGEGYTPEKGVKYRILYKFVTEDSNDDKEIGHYERVSGISEALKEELMDNGLPKKEAEKLFNFDKNKKDEGEGK